MVVYYHTKSYIYAVVNGYCKDVLETDGTSPVATHLVGHVLSGGVRVPVFDDVIPVDDIVPGDSLRFKMGNAVVITEPALFIERPMSLSVPPRPHTVPPSSLPPSEVFQVPRLPDSPESIRGPASRK